MARRFEVQTARRDDAAPLEMRTGDLVAGVAPAFTDRDVREQTDARDRRWRCRAVAG